LTLELVEHRYISHAKGPKSSKRISDFGLEIATEDLIVWLRATGLTFCGWKSVQMFLRYNNVDDSDIQKASEAIAKVEEELEKTKDLSRDFQNSSKRPNRLDTQIRKC